MLDFFRWISKEYLVPAMLGIVVIVTFSTALFLTLGPQDDTVDCITNEECALNRTCLNQKCEDPCMICGPHTSCYVSNHVPYCTCLYGFEGNRGSGCLPAPKVHAELLECTLDDECSQDLSCIDERCQDPCPRDCNGEAVCQVINHSCSCNTESQYFDLYFASCENLSECTTSEDCTEHRTCVDGKCKDGCRMCGANTTCYVSNHFPYCSCIHGFEGNPFTGCYPSSSRPATENKEKYYEVFVNEQLDWFMAIKACRDKGMMLVSIENSQQYEDILAFLRENGGDPEHKFFWTSGNDIDEYGEYRWATTGQPMTFTRWAEWEPSHREFYDKIENCVELRGNSGYNMNDRDCYDENGYICESI